MIDKLEERVNEYSESLDRVKDAQTYKEFFADIAKVGFESLRLATTCLAVPVYFGLKVMSKAMPVVWETAVQVIHIPAALISKIVDRDSPYNGQKINKIGNFLGETTEKIFGKSADVVETVARHL